MSRFINKDNAKIGNMPIFTTILGFLVSNGFDNIKKDICKPNCLFWKVPSVGRGRFLEILVFLYYCLLAAPTQQALQSGSCEICRNAYYDVKINIKLVSFAKMSENGYPLSKSQVYLVVVVGHSVPDTSRLHAAC